MKLELAKDFAERVRKSAIEAAERQGVKFQPHEFDENDAQKAAEAGVTIGMELHGYSLSPAAQIIYGTDTPIVTSIYRNRLPEKGPGEKVAPELNFRRVKDVIAPKGVVAFGARGELIKRETEKITKPVATIGLEDEIVREVAKFGAGFGVSPMQDFTNLKASQQIEERRVIGSVRTDLGAPDAPTWAYTATGGSLDGGDYTFKCTVGNFDLWLEYEANTSTFEGGTTDQLGESDASSASTTKTSAAASSKFVLSVAGVPGASCYLWYRKLAPGSTYLYCGITSTSTFLFDTEPTSTNVPPSTDTTGDANAWDGLIYQVGNDDLAEYVDNANAAFTSDSKGGIQVITDLLRRMYMKKRSKASPKVFYCDPDVLDAMTDVVLGNIPTGLLAQIQGLSNADGIVAGVPMKGIRHPLTNEIIPIVPHIDMPKGQILGLRSEAAMPSAEHPYAIQMDIVEDWYRENFARNERKDEAGWFMTGAPTVRQGLGLCVIANCEMNEA